MMKVSQKQIKKERKQMNGSDLNNICVWRDSALGVCCTHKSCWMCQIASPWLLYYFFSFVSQSWEMRLWLCPALDREQTCLLICWKNHGLPELSALQLWCKPVAHAASMWVYHVALWKLGQKRAYASILTLIFLFVLWVIKTIVSDPEISCLLLVPIK